MSNNYWEERMAKAQANIFNKNQRAISRQLGKQYRNLSTQVMHDFERVFDKVTNTMIEGNKPNKSDLLQLQKYWEMQEELDRSINRFGTKQIRLFRNYFKTHFKGIYNSIKIPELRVFGSLDESMVDQIINQIWCADGKSWSQRVWENVSKLKETLNEGLIHTVVTGRSAQDLKKELQERFNVSYSQADSLVRTELSHIQNQAAQQRYRDYGIEEVKVLADEDERRCEICGKLHNKVYSINDKMPIPAHPRCRCSIIPIVK